MSRRKHAIIFFPLVFLVGAIFIVGVTNSYLTNVAEAQWRSDILRALPKGTDEKTVQVFLRSKGLSYRHVEQSNYISVLISNIGRTFFLRTNLRVQINLDNNKGVVDIEIKRVYFGL
jgi:hypothetical protein